MKLNIRKAVKEDLPAVFDLIKELAEYEKAPQEVILTLDELVEDGFGENPVYWLNVAEITEANQSKKIIGIALFYLAYSTWKGKIVYLDDLVVNANYRRYGIGQKLIDSIIAHARQIGAKQIRWQVLDWNEPAINFYRKIDAKLDDEWINCKIEYEKLYPKG